ncbi:MAG: PaaI family thioesterase [Candidatus Limnocylindrales bacterium]
MADLTPERNSPAAVAVPLGDRRLLMRPHGCFACGELNVSGLHLQLHAGAGVCWAEPTLDTRFMGWEGIAHGGIICTILDEVMAWALVDDDSWGVTARMSVDFRSPVPIGQRLRAEGRVVDRHRRLIRTEGRLLLAEAGTLLATAEATYVDAPPDRKAELKRLYEFRIEPGDGASQPAWIPPWPAADRRGPARVDAPPGSTDRAGARRPRPSDTSQ